MVVTTPQYFLPEQNNVLHNSLPLHDIAETELKIAAEQLLPRVAHLPRPRLAVLVGGDSGRFVMTRGKGRTLGTLCNDLACAAGGSLLITDSARTPPSVADAILEQVRAPHFDYRWAEGGDNPYHGLLGLADAFVVTGESMSMLSEAANTGKPLYIFDVGDGVRRWWMLPHNYRYKPLSHRFAMRFGPHRMRRDIGNIQDALVDSNAAQWLSSGNVPSAAAQLRARHVEAAETATTRGLIAQEELQRAVQSVRRLVKVK